MRPNLPALKDAHHKIFYFTKDLKINGVTIGRGAGNISLNTAVGASALSNNTTGSNNTAVGYNAGSTITSGSFNTFIGYNARGSAGTNIYEIAIGNGALGLGSNTTVIGTNGATSLTTIYGALSLPDTTASTTTTTGALVVSGGAGIAGTLNVEAINVSSDLTVSGILTINGTTTTVNSSTLTVDDKNIELGSVVSFTVSTTGTIGSITGTGPWTATITGMVSTSNLIVGSTITATNGVGTLYGGSPTSVVVASIVSNTSITYIVTDGTIPTAGTVTNITTTGVTDLTANGGGITLKGATDKTIIWDSTNSNWTSSENWNIATSKTYKINNVNVLTANSVLSNSTQTSVSVGGYAATLNLGAVGSGTTNINTNSLFVGGKTAISTATVGIEVGAGRTGDGISYVDLVGDTTYTDYGLRVIRGGGANGNSQLQHRGGGLLQLIAYDAAPITFNTSNLERVRIDSIGNTTFKNGIVYVGDDSISTNSCVINIGQARTGDGNSYLDLVGDTTYPDFGTRLLRGAGASGNSQLLHRGTGLLQIIAQEATPIQLYTTNTERVRIAANGDTTILNGIFNVGGSALSTENSTINIGNARTGDGASYLDLVGDTTYPDYGTRLVRNGGAGGSTALQHRGTGNLQIIAQEAAAITFQTASIERVRINSSGQVGIGISSNLLADLHIYSATDTSQIVQDANSALRLLTVGGVNYIQSAATVVSDSAADLAIGSMFNISEWMRIKASTGNVLIGTATDDTTSKLQVNGTVKATAFIGDATGLTYTGASIRPSLLLDFANSKFLDQGITFTRATTATYYGYDGLLRIAASGEARFDHNPTTGESLGLLIEEARTNLLTYSENFNNVAWTKFNTTITANATTAPDGTLTADKLVENTATNEHYMQLGATVTTNIPVTFSLYFKVAEKTNTLRCTIYNSVTSDATRCDVNLASLTTIITNYGTSSDGRGNVASCGNGWYRLTISTIPSSTNSGSLYACRVAFLKDDNTTNNYTGDGTSGIYIWGAQLEAGEFATSYIPSNDTFTSRASTGTFTGSNGLIQSAATNVARYNYNPLNLALSPKLLLEPASTNLLTYSEQFDNVWNKTRSSITANTATAPDGTLTADTFIEDTSVTTSHYIYQSLLVTNALVYTKSIYVKAKERSYCAIQFYATNSAFTSGAAYFDLNTGVVTSVDASITNSSISNIGNGWYRISASSTATATTSGNIAFHLSSGAVGASYTGDGTSGIYIWGAQLETGTSATSYIQTVASQVTRAADVSSSAQTTRAADNAVMTGTNFSSWYRQDEGSFLAKSDFIGLSSVSQVVFSAADDSGNRHILYRTIGKNRTYQIDNSGIQAALSGTLLENGVMLCGAAAYKVNDISVSFDGVTPLTDALATIPAPNKLYIGDYIGIRTLNGHIAKLAYYPKRLSNAELQSITTG